MESKQEETKIITKEDLQKALSELQDKKEEVTEKTKVQLVELNKSTVEAFDEAASEKLKKEMTENDSLKEVVGIISEHIDKFMGVLTDNVNSALQRDVVIQEVLVKMKDELKNIANSVGKVMNEPATEPKSVAGTPENGPAAVMDKAAGNNDLTKNVSKETVIDGLVCLIKNLEATDKNESRKFTNVLITYESTGQISQTDLYRALQRK